MRRREFIAGLGAAAWPLAARAQQKLPVIGFLDATEYDYRVLAFRQGLQELGYIEDHNVKIEYRGVEGQLDRSAAVAADLVRRNVDVIAAAGSPNAALAAKAATSTIPIVFLTGSDPVQDGLVPSLNRPGQNVTGVATLGNSLAPKQVEILHEAVGSADTIGFLSNPMGLGAQSTQRQVLQATDGLGLKLVIAEATTDAGFERAFAAFRQARVGGIIVAGNAFFRNRRGTLVALAERFALPAVYPFREYVAAGGLMSYGIIVSDAYRLMGTYVGRILKGEKPTDLPVQQSTKVELVINMKTAKALGITVPLPLLGRADEVIE